jgi:hypothetical protein
MAENSTVKSNREKFTERMKTKYPDREFSDDDALFGQINDDYDNYDKDAAGYQEREKAFSDLFTSDPRSAAFLTSWRKGGNPAIELVRLFGDDFVEELKDPKKQEELAKASQEYAERVAKEKDFDEQYQRNLEETLATLKSIQEEEGKSDEEIDQAMEFLITIMKDGILGKFSRESINMAFKAINHDSHVEEAAHEGEVKGRNTKIEEKLRKASRSDGTANLDGKNGGGGQSRTLPDLGAIGRYDGGQNIWQRGGEKRTAYK